VTALWTEAFYDELSRGRSAAHALRAAQERVRAAPRTSDPQHWAGFVLVGDGDVRVSLARRLDPLRVGLAVAAVVGLLLAIATSRPRPLFPRA
jgi:hypothetical protein